MKVQLQNPQVFGTVKPSIEQGIQESFPQAYSLIKKAIENPELQQKGKGNYVLDFTLSPTIKGFEQVNESVTPILDENKKVIMMTAKKEEKGLKSLFSKEPRRPLSVSSEAEVEKAIGHILELVG